MPVRVLPDQAAWARAGVELILDAARRATAQRGRFCLGLAGGGTPAPVYELLAGAPWAEMMPWPVCHLFWGDERCVLPDDPRSNFGACRHWLTRLAGLGLAAGQVHRIPGETSPPARAAHLYDTHLRGFFAGGPPAFDLLLLGLGADGHIASLFPHSLALAEDAAWVLATGPPPDVKPAVARVSLTLPAINAAHQVVFLASGAAKAGIVARALAWSGPGTPDLPVSLVRPAHGEPLWLLDAQCLGNQSGS